MEKTYVIAYINKYTVEWAEKTGNAAGGWIRISGYLHNREDAINFFNHAQMDNSAVGLFRNSEEKPWFENDPRRLHNHHILVELSGHLSASLGALINQYDASYF